MNNLTLIIGNKKYSSWSLRPWLFLRHFKVHFIEKRISLFTDSMFAELAPYFSNNKVPVLNDSGFLVWDSLAIIEYVSERFLEGKGWPDNLKARATARAISAEMHSSFNAVRNAMPMNCAKRFFNYPIDANVQKDIDRITTLWQRCRTEYGKHGDWLFGEFSAADAMFAPIAVRFYGYDVALAELEQAYVNTILSHPDMQDWINDGKAEIEIIDDDEVTPPAGVRVEQL